LWLKFCDWIVILIWKIFNSNLFLSVWKFSVKF
jgi:hypothetical protein